MTHGEIWWIDFGIPIGSLPAYKRPAVILQNDEICGRNLNTVFVVPLTSNIELAEYVPNILFSKSETNLQKDSVAVIHLAGAVNKFALAEKISKLSDSSYKKLVKALESFIEA